MIRFCWITAYFGLILEIGMASLRNGKLPEPGSAVLAISAFTEAHKVLKSLRLRGFVEGQCSEKKEKRYLSLSLDLSPLTPLQKKTQLRPWRRLKLADFGSAEYFGVGNEKGTMRGVVGTPYYVAPEVLMGREYNEKVDVWSAGVILYIMLAGVPPFYGETGTETFEAVLRGNLRFPTRIFRSVSLEVKDLLRKMICKDVSRRLSAGQVLTTRNWIPKIV